MFYSNPIFSSVKKVIKIQLSLGVFCVLMFTLLDYGFLSIVSSLLGLCLALVPTMCYVVIAFGRGLVESPDVVLSRHKMAMLIKFIINIILFTIVFSVFKGCNFQALFITYFVTLSGYWFSLVKNKES